MAVAVLTAGVMPLIAPAVNALASTPPPALVQAQGLSGTTIELLWTAVPGATAYKIYRDASATPLASPTGTSYDDNAVSPLSTHSYRVTAIVGSESVLSSAATATAQASADTTAPTTPGTVKATSVTSSSMKLSWGTSTDNVGIEGYRVLVGPAGTPTNQLKDIYTTDAVASYTATNLRSSTSYTFGVLAVDAGGNLSGIKTVTVTTKTSTDLTAPTPPSNLSSRVFSSSRIDLWWSASSSTDVSGYQVLRNGVVVGQTDLPARMTFSDNGLSASTSYTYAVRTVDSAGNVSASSTSKSVGTLGSGTVIVARGPYVQWVTQSSARIVWWTNLPTQGVVSCPACPQMTSIDPTLTSEHVLLLGGLTGGTTYAYTVGDGVVSALGSFRTAAPQGATFSFAAIGDFGGGSGGESANASLIGVDGTSFIQTLGDNIYPEAADPNFATTYSDYDGRFFRQFAPALAQKAFWSANGNKEYYGNGAWFTHMSLPNNERWYSYDWGDAHILVLDTEQPVAPGTPQYVFAQSDLAAHQSAAWRLVALQRPAYSSSSANSSSAVVRSNLVPLFEAQHVNVVLSGNSHNSERTFPLLSNGDPNNPIVSPAGITYVVSGNGGNGFNAFTIAQPYWSAYRQATTYGYERVTVSPTSILLEEMSSTGTILGSATITGAAPTPGDLTGIVTDVNTSSPIAGASVSYGGGSTTTAVDGSYTFSGVPPGTYAVVATAAGYTSGTNSGVVVTSGTTTISNFALTPTPTPGAIAGTVTDASTAGPIAGATISYSGGSTTSGADGSYTLSNVAPGTYTVTATASSYTAHSNPAVVVTEGVTTTSDFTLTPAPPVTVFSDGFETGNLSNWTTTGGLTVQGVAVHAGAFAAEGNTTTGATYAKKLLPSTYDSGYLRAYIKVVSAASQVNLLRFRTAADGSIGYLFVTSSGALGLRNDVGAQTITSATTFSFGTWHSLEVHFTINGVSGGSEVWLDGAPVAALGATMNLGTTSIGKVQIGEVASGRIYDVLFDDVVFNTSPVGP